MGFNGQSGAEDVGGIHATVGMVTSSDFEAQRARIEASLKGLESHFGMVGTSAATASASINANMSGVTKATNMAGHRLQVFGQSLDDLQYVGEQGLRPIINNLMQISPALGIAAIAADQFYKRGDRLVELARNLAREFDIDLGSAGGEGTFFGIDLERGERSFRTIEASVRAIWTYVSKIGPAWGDLSGSANAADSASIAKFAGQADPEMLARGKSIADSIGRFGNRKFLDAMVDPALRDGNNADLLRKEEKSLVDLVDKARKGDRAAILDLEGRTAGKPVGDAIMGNLPGNKEGRKAMEEDEARRAKEATDDFWNEFLKDLEDVQKELDEIPKKQKLERQIAENVADFLDKDAKDRERLTERGSDLNWRLMKLRNPYKEGKTLTGDAYEASIKTQSGVTPELERLRSIDETLEEIRRNNRDFVTIARHRR